jgi:hypothetical protein
MVFMKKYPRSGETTHIRVPKVYAEIIQDLMEIFDKRFEPEQGKSLLRKYINNFQ